MEIFHSNRQAIITKYIGPAAVRGSRVKATSASGISIMHNIDHALSSEQNHAEAAKKLALKLGWTGRMAGGGLKSGYAFVFVD